MVEALIEILAQLGPSCAVMSAIVGAIALKKTDANTKAIKDLDNKLSANDLAIIRSKIKERADRCLDNGFITRDELEELDSLYDRYRVMGGNSFVKTLMEKINRLEVRNE